MEGLGFNNLLGADEIDNLFSDTEEEVETKGNDGNHKSDDTPDNPSENDDTKEKTTEDVDPEDLFGEEEKQPESVGSEKTEGEKEGSSADDGGGTSPNENFYSSFANAMAEDGVFPNLDEETIKKADDAESFCKLIDLEVEARLDDTQKRIKNALDNGVEPSDIKRYEGTLDYLSKLRDSDVTDESEKGERLRYNLIYQDFINNGYSPDKADKYAKRSIDQGTDVDDAKDALQSNREFFQKQYDALLEKAQKDADAEKAERQKQADKLKDSILKDKTLMGDMELSTDVRKRVFDAISKPVYRDPETGRYMTAIQRYEMENGSDFLKYVGLFYTLTDGFKDFESFTKGKVRKEVKKGLRDLEQRLTNSKRTSGGKMEYVTGVTDEQDDIFGPGFKLDIY